jgi:hypothetical protein
MRIRLAQGAGALVRPLLIALLAASPVSAGMFEDFLDAADAGECIEDVTFRLIRREGPAQADAVVAAALSALAARTEQQRALGCDGDIAAQAIAAGADPADVIKATAAGL